MGNFLLGVIAGVILGVVFKDWVLANITKLKNKLLGKKE